ncbi:MAG: serine/threonine protein kinase [Myxococcales bacterium]|nr:serine/threonine protein kinase [Myxococcales bacterium]
MSQEKPGGPSGAGAGGAASQITLLVPPESDDRNVPFEVFGGESGSLPTGVAPERIVAGRYIIEGSLGEGGMGRIFKVRHRDLGKLFALKIIHHDLARQPHIRDAFYREARMAAAMNHPNIIGVFDFGVDGHHGAFIVMDYLYGETLAERLNRERVLSPSASCDIMLQCAEGLNYMHGLGVIHCDIKPENIFLCASESGADSRRNEVRLLDFGLASRPSVDSRELVAATTVAGTPTYMAPERIRVQTPTPASDVYALGVLFYECLTGHPPFAGRLQDILYGHLRVTPIAPSRLLRTVPPLAKSLEDLVLRALQKEPQQRYQQAADFAFELRQIMHGLGLRRRIEDTTRQVSPRADLCEALVDACPLPLFVASPTCELVFGNGALGALLGVPPEELRGKLSTTKIGAWCPRIEREVRHVLTKQRTSRHPLLIETAAGEARGGWLTLAPYRRDGEVVGVCGVVAIMGDTEPP